MLCKCPEFLKPDISTGADKLLAVPQVYLLHSKMWLFGGGGYFLHCQILPAKTALWGFVDFQEMKKKPTTHY